MGFLGKFIARIGLNAALLYGVPFLMPGFTVSRDLTQFFAAALVIALVHGILRPILKVISFPLIIITFGLFNVVINLIVLYIADYYSAALTIADFKTLLISSIIFGFANSIF